MADTLGPLPLVGAPLITGVAAGSQAMLEFAQQPPPSLLLTATLAATVVGRGGNGALLLRTDYGTLALKTALPLPPGSRLDLRILPGPPPSVALLHIEEPLGPAGQPQTPLPLPASGALASPQTAAPSAGPQTAQGANLPLPGSASAIAPEPPSARLDLGTVVEATVLPASAGAPEQGPSLPAATQSQALAPGTRLALRITLAGPDATPPLPTASGQPVALAGTITGTAGDRTVVATPLGPLALDRLLALPAGTAVSVTRLATLPPAADAPAPAALGTVVEARLLSPPPGDAAAQLPAGSRLLVKVAPLPLAAPDAAPNDATLIGKVVAGTSTETMVETDLGTLALERRLALPAGTMIGLQRLAASAPEPPADTPVGTRWPALEQALSVLDRAAPELAARLRTDLLPMSGQQLAGTLLFLMGAVSGGTWPGAKAGSALEDAGRHDLKARLEGDAGELRQLAQPATGDWRVFVLPLLDGSAVRPVRLYLRRRQGGGERGDQGTRFVLDVDLSRLGALQFDGLVRQQRFDLVLRSHRAIAPEMRQDITALFRDATSAAGLAGDVIFTTASRFAVAPLEALRAHIGVRA